MANMHRDFLNLQASIRVWPGEEVRRLPRLSRATSATDGGCGAGCNPSPVGGKSKSPKKLEAVRQNVAKAREARLGEEEGGEMKPVDVVLDPKRANDVPDVDLARYITAVLTLRERADIAYAALTSRLPVIWNGGTLEGTDGDQRGIDKYIKEGGAA